MPDKVRRVAEVLRETSHQATRESYWWRSVAQLRAKLEEIGLPDERIRDQVRDFRAAVDSEVLLNVEFNRIVNKLQTT